MPRIDQLPQAVRSAELLRGTLVRCGPGVRGVGWPDTARVRAAALAPWFTQPRTAVLLTAAWVWGAAHSPGEPLEFASGERAGTRDEHGVSTRQRQLGVADGEGVRLGAARVTSPTRTVADLLRLPAALTREARFACRVLAAHHGASAHRVAEALSAGPAPYRLRALDRLAGL